MIAAVSNTYAFDPLMKDTNWLKYEVNLKGLMSNCQRVEKKYGNDSVYFVTNFTRATAFFLYLIFKAINLINTIQETEAG